MYPVLFNIGSFRVDTYSVIWFIALSIAIIWGIKRCKIYNIDEWEARSIIGWAFLFMLIGARTPEYIKNIKIYISNPSLFLDMKRGSLSEVGAITGAFLSAFILCLFNKKVSFLKLCDVSAPPAMLAIAIGRWGCFFNGCCVGIRSNFFTTVHFPRDPEDFTRHPVQIYYSIIAFIIIFILLYIEKKILESKKNYHSLIAPLALILYSFMRLAVAFVRIYAPVNLWINLLTYRIILFSLPFEIVWLILSLRRMAADNKY